MSTNLIDVANSYAALPRVVSVMQCTNLGGMEQSAYDMMRRLRRKGIGIRITTPRPFGPGRDQVLDFDPTARDFKYSGRFGWRTIPALRSHFRNIAVPSCPIWLTGTDACSLLAMRSLPNRKILGHHYHHFENRFSKLRWALFYRLLCRRLDCIFYPTEFTRSEALRIAPWIAQRSLVIRYPFEVAFPDIQSVAEERKAARERLGIHPDAFVVGNAGWLIPRKRWDVFLHTVKLVADRIPNAQFYICGGGPDETLLRRMVDSLGISEKIVFPGWVKNMEDYYKSWDVCLFNSDYDAFGRTQIEAACLGSAIVASVKNGGLGEFIESGRNGFLFNSHDPQELADAIVSLAEHPDLANAFRTEAARTIRSLHSPETIMKTFEQVLFPC